MLTTVTTSRVIQTEFQWQNPPYFPLKGQDVWYSEGSPECQVIADLVPRKPKLSFAVYPSGDSLITYLRGNEAEAAACGIQPGDRVKVKRVRIIDAQSQTTYTGLEVTRDPNGVKVMAERKGVLIRVRNLFDSAMSAQKFPVETLRNKFAVVLNGGVAANDNQPIRGYAVPRENVEDRYRIVPDYLTSMKSDAGWKKRLAMLAENSNAKTTNAGDACFSPDYLTALTLRSAGRKEFDIDVCTMQADGRYDLSVPNGVTVLDWGTTPKALRDPALVVGHVPALRRFTNDTAYGSLAREWNGKFIWLNPPYALRAWAAFCEKANYEVECENCEIVVALVPCDDTGPQAQHLFGKHAYRIGLSCMVPFFKRSKMHKGKLVRDVIDVIRGNQFVVFGKGRKTRDFLLNFVAELRAIGYISEAHFAHYVELFSVLPRLQA
jgi:hypothetical protein